MGGPVGSIPFGMSKQCVQVRQRAHVDGARRAVEVQLLDEQHSAGPAGPGEEGMHSAAELQLAIKTAILQVLQSKTAVFCSKLLQTPMQPAVERLQTAWIR